MRRSDRAVIEESKIDEIIRKCACCRVGFYDEGKVYIVPLSFGYSEENGRKVFYFHSAKEGRKIELIKSSPHVGFEMDTGYELRVGDKACNYSAAYQSVIGNGKITFVEVESGKQNALQEIMYHNTGKRDWDFTQTMLDSVYVFKLVVDSLSCKERI
ncbi:MAG TPA: pyridoxamine 5'-phosphate oxidase family protein [Bacillota bacterium]|nr:pyridoxamine 5'-phosphate oxidase family protein [Bacillota bacterium]